VSSQSGSRRSRVLRNGDEEDALTAWKRYVRWAPGERRRIKRGFNRRQRREGLEDTRGDEEPGPTSPLWDLIRDE
jgi:hypothetical protein